VDVPVFVAVPVPLVVPVLVIVPVPLHVPVPVGLAVLNPELLFLPQDAENETRITAARAAVKIFMALFVTRKPSLKPKMSRCHASVQHMLCQICGRVSDGLRAAGRP
jgi:hypothetical protein